MRRSSVRIPSRPPDSKKETYTIFESARSSKSISAISPLIKLSRAPHFLYSSGGLACCCCGTPWIGHEPLSLVETVTMLHGPKLSSHAVFADHRTETHTRYIFERSLT